MNVRTVVALLIALGAQSACGEDTADSGGDGVTDGSASVEGRTFLSTGVTPRPLVPGTQIRLMFDGDAVTANAGCNTLSGQARIEGGRLQSTGAFGMTEMGCDQPLMDQDSWLASLLGSGPAASLDGDVLTLSSDDGTVVELLDRRVADPDRSLAGTEWRLDAIIHGSGPDGAVSSVPHGAIATLRISEDGQLALTTGCNTGSGTADMGDGVLRLDWTYLTEMDCTGGRAQVEQAVQATLLQGEIAYSIEADRLTLTSGAHGLVYRAES